jgi:hypothetical protein
MTSTAALLAQFHRVEPDMALQNARSTARIDGEVNRPHRHLHGRALNALVSFGLLAALSIPPDTTLSRQLTVITDLVEQCVEPRRKRNEAAKVLLHLTLSRQVASKREHFGNNVNMALAYRPERETTES